MISYGKTAMFRSRCSGANTSASSQKAYSVMPPASTISLPCGDSGKCVSRRCYRRFFGSREGRVTARDRDQEHRQHLAITQVHFEKSLDQGGDHDRDGPMQYEALVTWPGWQFADAATEIGQRLNQGPHQQQHRGDPPLGCVLEIDIVQVALSLI